MPSGSDAGLPYGGIPVVAVYRDGAEAVRFNGEKDYDDLCDILDKYV